MDGRGRAAGDGTSAPHLLDATATSTRTGVERCVTLAVQGEDGIHHMTPRTPSDAEKASAGELSA
ncbi:hypothetical protein [Aeromicrobium sp. NPDC092404]|uniref:hypothetical protein n=1 Tax=Aeromicrobium sp. NPDC092404 TaxID=3154976 RepID=UPI0034377124